MKTKKWSFLLEDYGKLSEYLIYLNVNNFNK